MASEHIPTRPGGWSIRTQLALALTLVAIGTGALVGLLAYRENLSLAREGALRTVAVVARDRAEALSGALARRHERARALLELLPAACGDRPGANECLRSQLETFRATERLRGVRLELPDGAVLVAGTISSPRATDERTRLLHGPDGTPYLVLHELSGGFHLCLESDGRELMVLFTRHEALGENGESFLTDADGHFITPPRYAHQGSMSHSSGSLPMQRCLAGEQGAMVAPDYRGVMMIHGFRPMPELGGGCIMAHVDPNEAFAPAIQFRRRAAVVALCCALFALVISLIVSWLISAPVIRLTAAAERLRREDFQVPPESPLAPKEVRGLHRALSEATSALGTSIKEREDLVRFQREMMGILSHDLRNPLGAITLSASQLAQGERDERDRRLVDRIRSSAARMTGMVSALLDVARSRSAGGIPVQRGEADLCALTRDVVEEAQAAHPGRAVIYEAQGGCRGEWDAARLGQALSNLIGNALQHGSPEAKVTVRTTVGEEEAVAEVHNEGRPIPPDTVARLFQPFQRGDGSGGLGLGLYIADQIVRAHGGRIEVESEAARGTTFRIHLPVRPSRPFVESGAETPVQH